MDFFKKDRKQGAGNEIDREIDDEFLNSNIRLGTRLNRQRVLCNFRNLSILQKLLIAILLTTAIICVGLLVSKKPLADVCSVTKHCQNGGTCVGGINSYTCACAEGYEGRDCASLTNKCAASDNCTNGGTCVNGMNSVRCICSDGFVRENCQNVNMCRYPGTCAALNDAKSCGRCRDGFVKDPEDNTRCKYANGNASLIISSEVDIRMISLDRLNTTQIIQNKDLVLGTDYNFRTNTIFWFSESEKQIYSSQINEEAERKNIFHDISSEIYGVAVDWMHQHLYWVDTGRHQITVSNLNGTMKKVLFHDGLSVPYSIAVNPLSGWMYWSDNDEQRIERAGLDGSRREVILSTNIKNPHSLVADLEDHRLYWSQGGNPSSIWSCEFDGSDPKLIFTPNSYQFVQSIFLKIATYDKFVYFSEGYNQTIYKVNKCNGKELTLIYKSESNMYDFKIYDATQQPDGENLCLKRIGLCSHFCFPVPSPGNGSFPTTTCACPDGLSLSADQQNCV